MSNVYSPEDHNSLLSTLNDFTLTVLAPIPNNSHLLALWYKFKPFLTPEGYDPQKIQSFLSSIDPDSSQSSFKKPPLSTKLPSDVTTEGSKEYLAQLNMSRGDSASSPSNGEGNSDVQKRSSYKSSNSSMFPNLGNPLSLEQETVSVKEAEVSVKNNELQYYHSKSDKPDTMQGRQSIEPPTYRKELPSSVRESLHKETFTTRPQYTQAMLNTSIQDLNTEDKQDSDSRKTVRKYEDSSEAHAKSTNQGFSGRISGGMESKMTQRVGDNSHPDPPTPPKNIAVEGSKKVQCPPALEYLAKTMNRPYSAVADLSLYTKFFVLEAQKRTNTFYQALAVEYFMGLLSDRNPSLALSSLYEKVIIRKLKLNYYPDMDKLYESVTGSLKVIIKEKIANPGQSKFLQELFLSKFYEDSYFREGLVALLKEQLIEYISCLDFKSFHTLFRHTKLERLVATIRSNEDEPTEEMIAAVPYIVEGNLEVHYIRSGKIDIVLYNQKTGKSFRQTPFAFFCLENSQNPNQKTYQGLVTKDQAEILEKMEKRTVEEDIGMKDTVYMSMDSESSQDKALQLGDFNSNNLEIRARTEETMNKPAPMKHLLNRNLLLSKVHEVSGFMNKHTDKLADLFAQKVNPPKAKTGLGIRTAGLTPTSNTQGLPQYSIQRQAGYPPALNRDVHEDNSSTGRHRALLQRAQSDRNQSTSTPKNQTTTSTPKGGSYNLPSGFSFSKQPSSPSPNFQIRPTQPSGQGSSNKINRPMGGKEYYRMISAGNYGTSAQNSVNNGGSAQALNNILQGSNKAAGNNTGRTTTTAGHNVSYTIPNMNQTGNTSTTQPVSPQKKKFNEEDWNVEKENKEASVMNIRSPLKRIVVYSHQKDVAFANVEKEASAINTAKLVNGPEKWIFEDATI